MLIFHTVDIRIFNDNNTLNEAIKNSSKFRLTKYNGINNEVGKLQVIANTYLLNKCLNEVGLFEKNMEYEIGKFGKPRFTNISGIHFNLSHSKNMALAVISDENVGCDIQFIDKVDMNLIDKVLSNEEKEYLLNKDDYAYNDCKLSIDEKFYRLWVMKEAILKKEGIGLNTNLKSIHSDKVYFEKRKINTNNDTEEYVLAIY